MRCPSATFAAPFSHPGNFHVGWQGVDGFGGLWVEGFVFRVSKSYRV